MRNVLIGLCLAAVLVPTLRAAEVAADTPAAPATETPAAAAMTIPEAVEGVLDEDEPTRKKAFARLEAATETDIPALEKFEEAKDPEIRRQVALVLQRVRRGEVIFQLKFADGTPAAGQKVDVKLIEVKMPEPPKEEASKDGTKETDPKVAAAGGANQIQVQVAGGGQVQVLMAGGGQVMVNGMPANGKMVAQPILKEVLSTELTADADGKISLGRFNDGKYQFQLTVSDGLPMQRNNGSLELKKDTPANVWEVRRGVNAKITVLDTDGQPIKGALVFDLGGNTGLKQTLLSRPVDSARRFTRGMRTAETDDKGVAELEGIGLQDINLVVLKEGCEPLVTEKVAAVDGKPLALDMKIQRIKPKEITVKLKDVGGSDLAGYRFLLIVSSEYGVVIGAQPAPGVKSENAIVSADKFDEYIKAGAVDLGKVDTEGKLKANVLPTNYVLLGSAPDSQELRLGNINTWKVNADTVDATVRNPNAAASGKKQLKPGIQPMPAIAPAPEGLRENVIPAK